ncbi:glycine--tRNA ligase subunit beta [Synechococcus sp. A15-44]|uniref:glycine--tRNA ligase subunit beta n=1 Tax=Synechococcus sp. A15-44 TaxID=1050646 RepID=UPI0016452222|nr:glycine--tRNA ligase subunit beta [Synechococcus sp. A15-44]QNI64331.1 glycyl-tRNA synthetase/ beta subunit [Synechococcus sp. A15-44]
MTATFLLEIGTEELPADFVRQALDQLQQRVSRDLREARLGHGAVSVFGTPRRLVVSVADLEDRQPDLEEDRKGPPVVQAFKDGVPGPAAIGFAKRCGVDPSALEQRDTPKGPCVFATVLTPGQACVELLQGLIPQWIDALQGRRFMRWGTGAQRFSRPIRWLLALKGSEVIPVVLGGADPEVRSDRFSRAHRLHGDEPLSIASAEQFGETLAAAGVVVDRADRAKRIRTSLDQSAQAANGTPDCPESLFEELVDLVEDPRILEGTIAERFLQLPPEVISTVMQAHQRYVPLQVPGLEADPLRLTAEAVLRPQFLLVGNGLAPASSLIVRGNERVLGARLADAEFFLDVDRRQSSESRREALDRVTFAEGLGSLLDRSERIERLTGLLLKQLGLDQSVVDAAQRAAHFCKNDLVSQMVGEFPELQGLMGGKYLLEEGEPRDVALAVVEHYLPRGAGDALPATPAGAVVALAERLELLLSIFAKGERPTGSSDPYALRRAGNGVVQILWGMAWRLDLMAFLSNAVEEWAALFPAFAVDASQLHNDLCQLMRQRIVSQLEDDGFAPDLVQAVAGDAVSSQRLLSDPLDVKQRIQLLRDLRDSGQLDAVQAVVQRAAKLAEKGDLARDQLVAGEVVEAERFESASEKDLFAALEQLQPLAQQRSYQALADALVAATPALQAFFDGDTSVMVMVDDATLRLNRLNLLAVLRNQASVLAEFESIQSK